MIFIVDPMTASAAFQKGETHIIQRPSIAVAVDLVSKGYPLLQTPGGKTALAPDTKNAGSIFNDIRIRQAIEYAIDRQTIATELGHGFLIPANQFEPYGSPAYNPNIGRPYDPDQAKRLLAAAGYPTGFKTTIICSVTYSIPEVMTAIQGYLAAVGIEAKLDYADPGRWTEIRTKSGWKDALLFTYNGFFTNVPRSMVFVFSERRADNASMARPPGCEDLLQKILATQNFEEQKVLMQQMSKLLYDNCMYVPLYFPATMVVTQKNVHDTGIYAHSQLVQWAPEKAWISK
jgi:ABC-type transport system substrate-binding protein